MVVLPASGCEMMAKVRRFETSLVSGLSMVVAERPQYTDSRAPRRGTVAGHESDGQRRPPVPGLPDAPHPLHLRADPALRHPDAGGVAVAPAGTGKADQHRPTGGALPQQFDGHR